MANPEYLCAPWTAALGPDPVGSAPRFDQLVLVEVPLPWPRDVSDMPWLEAVADRDPLTRVMSVVPPPDRAPDVLVTTWRRSGGLLVGSEGVVAQDVLATTLDQLLEGVMPAGFEAAPDEVLVCGHGARDRCCGNQGTRLFTEAYARGWPVRVRRCSHLGGHRFAPTAMTLPDGRLWSHLDPDVLDGVVNRTADTVSLHDSYRGSSGLDPWAQVVERAVFEHLGWGWVGTEVTVCEVTIDGESAGVVLSWDGGAAHGVVERAGTYPVIDCGQPPEAAEKTSDEYRLAELDLR